MAQGKSGNERLTRDELALMDAFEARFDGPDDGQQPGPPLSAELQAELDDFVALSQRIATLDDVPAVSPSVRSVVLSAAAAQTQATAEPKGLAKWLLMLLRPAPMAGMGIAAAVLLAVAVRPDAQGPASDAGDASAMVAMEQTEPVEREPGIAAPNAAAEAANVDPAEAREATAAPAGAAAAAAKPAVGAAQGADAQAAGSPRPRRMFAATPASVGPGGEQPSDGAAPPPSPALEAARRGAPKASPVARVAGQKRAAAKRVRAARDEAAPAAPSKQLLGGGSADSDTAKPGPKVWDAKDKASAANTDDETVEQGLAQRRATPKAPASKRAAAELAKARQQAAPRRAVARSAPSRRADNYLAPTQRKPRNEDFSYAAADRPSSAPSGVQRVAREAERAAPKAAPKPAPRPVVGSVEKRSAPARAKRPAAQRPLADRPTTGSASAAASAKRDTRPQRPEGAAGETKGAAKKASDASAAARQVTRLKARYAKATTDTERRALLLTLSRTAQVAGDTATVAWAKREAKQVSARLAAKAASRKRPAKPAAKASSRPSK